MDNPRVGVIMGSKSDWPVMANAVSALESLGIAHEVRVMSAHRTPDIVIDYAGSAEERGLSVIIAAAGGAAHLAGVVASSTLLPVLGVPMQSGLQGLDSLLSTVQMPAGVPVGTLAIGKAGAVNAAIFAAQILGVADRDARDAVKAYRNARREAILAEPDPRE